MSSPYAVKKSYVFESLSMEEHGMRILSSGIVFCYVLAIAIDVFSSAMSSIFACGGPALTIAPIETESDPRPLALKVLHLLSYTYNALHFANLLHTPPIVPVALTAPCSL